MVERAHTSLQAGLGIMVPMLECRSLLAPLATSSTYRIPFIPAYICSLPSLSTYPDSQIQPSALNSSLHSSMKSLKPLLLHSSSPSITNLTVSGDSPKTSVTALRAAILATILPLLSLTPRPNNLPSLTTGSNGGDSHSLSGSGGWTS